eukprot:scaffold7979_cov417-Prasinococcus_capsulatus_cf.AAC.1
MLQVRLYRGTFRLLPGSRTDKPLYLLTIPPERGRTAPLPRSRASSCPGWESPAPPGESTPFARPTRKPSQPIGECARVAVWGSVAAAPSALYLCLCC